LIGFSIVSALPGPLFNFSIYVGALVNGFVGAITGFVFLFAPAFLMIWGILPFWTRYRNNKVIKCLLKGKLL
jgi:chromate transporter